MTTPCDRPTRLIRTLALAAILAPLASTTACGTQPSSGNGTFVQPGHDIFAPLDIVVPDTVDTLQTDTASDDIQPTDDTQADTAITPDAAPTDTAATCTDPCEPEGGARCDADNQGFQRCIDADNDGCFAWTDTTACAATEVCTDGACAPKCPDQDCTATGAKKCSADGKIVTCFDFNGDGCLAWGGATGCPGTQVCAGGFCALSCQHECTTAGAKKCEGKAVLTCGDSNKDGCLDWADKSACAATQICSGGFCADTCTNECTTKGATQCDATGIQTCDDYSKDGCLQWGTAAACPTGETCSAGVCAKTCKSECTVKGATACQLGKVATCGDFNGDGCLQWGSPVPCAKGLVCAEGKCAQTCSNECTVKDAKRCSAAGAVQVCGDFDGDACLQWGSGTSCGSGTVCSNGVCAATCSSGCEKSGEKRCVAGSKTQHQTCGDYNKDGCLQWGTAESCPAGLVCAGAGACEKSCQSTCQKADEKVCENNAVRACGDFNKDGCLELGTAAPCEAAETCSAGQCKAKPAPAKVVINELVYDSAGTDTETFVELAGPPGTPLGGFTLVGINGNGGVHYATVPLAGAIGADGLFVVAHKSATGAIKAAADQLHSGVDFQNGPDNVALRFGAETVDAVGYGTFGGGLVFKGEGKPTVDVAPGQALGRDDVSTDTDDNSLDFRAISTPTPGAKNPKPCAAKTCADQKAACGTIGDGCGEVLQCGDCSTDKVCGADHQCGDKPCEPKTCKDLGVACGAASDGCDKTLACGECGADKQCDSGGGKAQCVCKPKTCKDLGKVCGPASDGCAKALVCGSCATGTACADGQCVCEPTTCKALGVTCGTPADGCGDKLSCGTCADGKVCGPAGQCDCAPKSCGDLKLVCGPASDGCGKALTCGECGQGKQCEKGVCVCEPKACADLGCGQQPDGCGDTIDCGSCGGECGKDCPAGWQLDSFGVCKGGALGKIDLSYCTVKVSGSITHNGQKPATSQYCTPSKNSYSTYVQVKLTELTWGYVYTITNTCSKGATQGFNWDREIFPGIYKVEVYGTANYADFPVGGSQIIYDKLDLTAPKAGIALDYKTVKVSGSITHNGTKPATSEYCTPSKNSYSTYVQVKLTELTWGYVYTITNTCSKGATQAFNWDREIFPGTYKVEVYGTTNYADFPIGGSQIIYDKLDLTAPKAGIVLDYKTVKVSGSITHNGTKPATSEYCTPSKNSYSTYVQVKLTELTWGYVYTITNTCSKGATQAFNWDREIFPGIYKVEVYGTSNYADFPIGGSQIIYDNLDLTAPKAGIVLDYKTVKVSGSITHNGTKPATSEYCTPSKNSYSTYVQVKLTELTWGYVYTITNTCSKGATQGFNWDREIFPGTYKVEVYGTTNYADFPIGGSQIIYDKLDLTAPKAGIVLDYKTVKVSGSITHNGTKPATSQYCTPSTNGYSTYVQVKLTELTWGYTYTITNTCSKGATQGFNWDREIFPGTYKVEVYGTTNYADFPIGGSQIIFDKLDLTAAKAGIVLDYKTVKVSGDIFANGKTPALSKYCSASTNSYSTYVQVMLKELTWGYSYSITHSCSKGTVLGFSWEREIFAGVYKVEVYGTSNYANFPIGGSQVVIPKIALMQ